MKLFKRNAALLAFTILMLSLFVLGSSPDAIRLFTSPLDKLVHVLVYFLMTVLLWFGLPLLRVWLPALLVALVGCADEVHQLWVPGRFPGIDDLGADMLGILIATVLITRFSSRKRRV